MKSSTIKFIEQLRTETGLSQAELARRAGFSRSVVNAYERGNRQPSVDALVRLATAAGYELSLVPRRTPVDQIRAGNILEQVVGLAEMLPYKPSSQLEAAPLPPLRPGAA